MYVYVDQSVDIQGVNVFLSVNVQQTGKDAGICLH